MPSRSVVIVTNSYDRRDSTKALRHIADALGANTDTKVSVFLLRHTTANEHHWPNARVVDDLRTWWPSVLAQRLISPSLAAHLRGLRLRRWLRLADPDVVVLDDGLGLRVVEHLRRKPVLVSRINVEQPSGTEGEDEAIETPDIVLASIGVTVTSTAPIIREHSLVGTFGGAARYADAEVRRRARGELDLPEDEPIVVGWGSDGWLDGSDIFVRVLWALQNRHGLAVHGLWLGAELPHEARQLNEEAARCGLSDRFHLLPYQGQGDTPREALCGDAVLLPTREVLLPDHLVLAAASGLQIVTFRAADVHDKWVVTVDDLDIDAAAAELATALDGNRATQSNAAMQEVDIEALSLRLLERATQLKV